MADKLFGTDGVRGVANVYPLTADFCLKLATVLSNIICKQKKRVAIARDTRISGQMLFSALSAGFTAAGIDVLDLGIIPTPLCTTLTPTLDVDMSIMITASHNPFQDNGLKLIKADGNKFSDAQTDALEKALAEATEPVYDPQKIGSVQKVEAGLPNYMQTVAKMAAPNALSGMKIALDSANGVFAAIMPQIFSDLGAEIISLADSPNGYNINLDCGSQHTENLSRTVVEQKCDMGVAVDGDGDRIIICDENGKRLDGDQIIAFLATYLHKHQRLKANAAVATIYSNLGLGKYIRSLGLDFYATPVGERYVIEKMQQTGANLGGEESGHMVLSDYALTGDALLAAITVCLGIKEIGQKVSRIFPVFKPFPSKSYNLRFENKQIITEIMARPEVTECIEKIKAELAEHGMILVRKSGTEPVIRLKVEDEDEALAEQCAARVLALIKPE